MSFSPRCPKCKTLLHPGIALAQTWTSGTPDFHGETRGMTFSPGGPGKLINCYKCYDCGWSMTVGHGVVEEP